ncbi:MAG: hypothetical protein LBH67_01760 [Rickettsia sp.]|jgi:6-phosphogluconate dehydrogenase|nr:hypothetical protein [Rickettsia sp.]
MVGDEINDEGYESGDNCSDIVEAIVERTVSAMVNAKLEPASTLSEVNKEIDTTVAKPTTVEKLQEAVQWIVSDIQNRESASNIYNI